VHRLVVPIEQFLLFLVAVIALYELKFPEVWNVHLFKLTLQEVIDSVVKLFFIILLIRVSLRTLEFISIILEERSKLTKDQTDDQLVLFFRDFFKVILYIIGVLLVLRYVFNENIGNLVTSLSIVGAAVALSMRESLENIIASFIIFFDKPFTVGDLVKVNNFTGTIEKIGLRSTRIRTQDKTYITVPNKQMVDTIVDNISLRSERKIEMDIQLSVQTSASLLSALSTHVRLMIAQESNIISSSVFVAEAGKQSHVIHVECFISMQVDINSLQQLREKLNVAVIEFANQHQIQFSDKG
jgi:MscS family membrane protein